ncbi:hypothetical protein SS1G_09760 [Sclerotinia sclerotiorum 1980 UF-70]|uniref:Xylanolytic transcriptional activator regulatory domain-containing protein n=1 Tax=Sclerotinia sclerotiorum (strain ATCC 18683 / 1980 / Ss-1) TaxID=665079 RepID=A7EWQ1_SCLS1|nr:hypothetical protein SS1G_09760 [Sclerotinia sclerotiorum 1980 UF-70]EDN93893.1 hypothetical protein SS1G_09760 [Sclerotinia sclerotiorum 1980 UF-70]
MSEASPIPPDGSISDMSPATSTATSSSKPRQCIPATQLPRQRRRRFPERVLLDRLREYEDLLRQNNIKFEPLHKESTAGNESCQMKDHNDSNDEQLKTAGANASSPWQAINFERAYGTTDDRNSLTALFFYLLSIRSNSVPQSLSSMLAVAIRIAQRLGCHNESVLSQLNPLEAELRRRLWWSLVLYDSRMGELADSKTTILNPTWDCKILLNVSDSDFHLVMKDPPKVQGKPTEAIFTVLRSEVGNYIRNTKFYLGFNDLPIKPAAKDMQYDPTTGESELADLEKLVEEKYLKFCDPENPVHFMAIWMTRMSLAKWHLVEHWHFSGKNRSSKIGLVREATVAYALNLLECDTRLMSSPLAKGFTWMTNMYFPFPAYFQIVQNLKQRPLSQQAEHAWQIMTANYEVRFRTIIDDQIPEPFFKIFAKIILLAWEVREQAFKQMGQVITEPQIVINIRREVVKLGGNTKESEEECERTDTDMDVNNFSILAPMGFFRMAEDEYGHGYGYPGTGTGTIGTGASYTDTPGIGFVDGGISQLDWSAMDWNALNGNTPAHGTGTGTGSFPY